MMTGSLRYGTSALQWLILFVFLCLPGSLYSQDRDSAPQKPLDPQLERNLRLAYGYHELAKLYIKKGEPDKAASEIRKLLQLTFPDEYEHFVIQSVAWVAEKLAQLRRFDQAQDLLDETLKSTDQPANQAKVFKTKARLFLASGDDDKAIESWTRALELDRQ